MYVLDATPLIYLATVGRLALLEAFQDDRLVPAPVHEEVVTAGLDAGHADARRVDRAVDDDVLRVVPVPDTETVQRLLGNENCSEADAAVLGVADNRGATAVMDESYGRNVADAEGIPTRGTAYLVLALLEDGVIDAGRARATIDDMVDAGWYCAPDVYAAILREIEARSAD